MRHQATCSLNNISAKTATWRLARIDKRQQWHRVSNMARVTRGASIARHRRTAKHQTWRKNGGHAHHVALGGVAGIMK